MKNTLKKKKIQLLPPELTNQIAAGEVVERPASVVKELVENALDAHASDIVVTIENGGQSLIAVEDNGIGISKDELELAVTRHATSKLHDIAGLSQIDSYGFRGEALPSIASVSSFSIVSRFTAQTELENLQTIVLQNNQKEENILELQNDMENSTEAAILRVEFGKVQELAPSSWQKGTRIEVRDLFFNIPARLKFLKSPATELKKTTELFVRLALVAQNVNLSLYAGSRLVHTFKKSENTKERLAHIWPPAIVETLLPVAYKANGITVTGFISHPRSHQPRSDRMLYYVNGRAVSDKILMRATKQAFQGKLTTRDYPQCFLCINLAPAEVDVNVHPAKNEVRFRDEQNLFVTIMRAITLALEKDTSHFSAKHLAQTPDNISSIGYTEQIAEQASFFTHENLKEHSEHKDIINNTIQEARLGDLFIPKPKGFWGDMDKEQGLSFIIEQAEKKRQEAQNSSSLEEWRVIDCSPETQKNNAYANTIYKNEVTLQQENQAKYVNRHSLSEPYTPIETLPEGYNSLSEIRSHETVETIKTPSFSREEEHILHAKHASACLPQGLVYIGQIAKTYLVLQKFDQTSHAHALILLDQHAIHERILYEEAKKGLVNSQNLLLPLEFPLHKAERARLEEVLPLLEKLAFKVEMNSSSCRVFAIPATLTKVAATGFFKDVLAQKADDLEKIWISHSCKGALKAHTELDTQSALKLILRWLETEEPDYCPHGRPCVLHFDAEVLEQMFKRKQ